ncbi:hypothetical protein FHT87_005164 [Rhizobium sp. BK316]|uniref:hypothetical protein n=1 Tax=Rhizobium sp. BK316 TaxID=2587053 RepID=UPI00161C9F26|nr:hypothetical protein [Rhizobium sp. BK316]MBB3411211.1 hypothetical protein [Rhizobium sp. BK316]
MTTTAFTGPVATFTEKPDGTAAGYSDMGFCAMSQTTLLTQNSTNAVSSTLYMPFGSQIVDIIVDVLVAFDSATSATLTAGTAAAGTQYASGVNAKTAGRVRPTFTAAQLAAMDDIGTTPQVVFTITPVGATTAGSVRVTVLYVQQPQAGDTP